MLLVKGFHFLWRVYDRVTFSIKGSLVDLDQQIVSNAKYRRQTDPIGGLHCGHVGEQNLFT